MTSYGYLLPTRDVVASAGTSALQPTTTADVLERARLAERLGFESAWAGDGVVGHPRPEALTTLAAVGATTNDLALGTAIYLPNLRHVVHVAQQTATVARIAGRGRLLLGVGAGGASSKPDHRAVGVPYDRRGEMLDEGLAVLQRLWSGDPVTHHGEFYDLDAASIGFAPPEEPAVLVASTAFDPEKGFPARIRRRLRRHDGWLPSSMPADEYATGLDRIERLRAADEGGSSGDFVAACYVNVVVADTEERAVREAQAYLRAAFSMDLSEEVIRRTGAFGPVERVAETLSAYRDAGVETFVVRFTTDDHPEQLRRFGEVIA